MMAETLAICMAQMTSTNAHAGNIDTASAMVATAAGEGAELMCLPEAANLMQRDRARGRRDHPAGEPRPVPGRLP